MVRTYKPAPLHAGDTLLEDRLLRLPEVESMVGLQKSTLYALARQGRFPHPIKRAKRASRWRLSEVQAFIAGTYQSLKAEPVAQLVRLGGEQ